MSQFVNDFRLACRTLRKNPGFASTAILALALGIGANCAVFSVVNSVLLRPLGFPESDRIVKIWGALTNLGIPKNWISPPEFVDLTQQSKSFSGLAAFTDGNSFNLSGIGTPQRLSGAMVTPSFFSTLKAKIMLGRDFRPQEGSAGADHVVVLSYPLWKQKFGGDEGIVGRTIQLNGSAFEVIGVAARGVDYPEQTDLWAPTQFSREELLPDSRGDHNYEVVARLKDGVSAEQAQTDLNIVAANLARQYPDNYPANAGWSLSAVPLITEITGDTRPALLVLMAAVGMVLLVACVNVANLLLSRAATRKREMAIRSAIGASQWHIIRQLLTESVTLAFFGGAIGLALAYGALHLFRSAELPGFPRMTEVAMHPAVLWFTLAVTLITGIAFGLAPALQTSEISLLDALKSGGSQTSAGRGAHRLRSGLIVAEVALTLTLLFGAGLLFRSFMELQKVSPGINPERVLTMRISLMEPKYQQSGPLQTAFFQELEQRLNGMPGVSSLGFVSGLPLSNTGGSGGTRAEGIPNPPGQGSYEADRRSITPDYLRTMGIQLREGRPFTAQDSEKSPLVVIVDDVLAEHFWPGADPIGKRIMADSDVLRTVVGVVHHVKNKDLESKGRGQVYYPLPQRPRQSMFLTLKTIADPMSVLGQVRTAINEVDPNQPIYEIKTMQSLVDASLARRRLSSFLLTGFAGLALVLAMFGVYGVTSYLVAQRTQEIGIRMALGADRQDIFRLILSNGMAPVIAGLGLGGVCMLIMSRLLRSLLFGVKAADPVTIVCVAATLLLLSFVANYLPTVRAMRIEPMQALRAE